MFEELSGNAVQFLRAAAELGQIVTRLSAMGMAPFKCWFMKAPNCAPAVLDVHG